MLDCKKNTFHLDCDCGCGILKIENMQNDGFIYFSYLISAFYSHQETWLDKIRKRLCIFWMVVILGKEYSLYDIILSDNNKLQEFKDYVSSLGVIRDDS